MDHLPIFCQLRDRDCLIVGGGDVAERKARLLLDAGARLTVNALAFIPQFTAWADAGMLTLVEGPFDESLLDTCWLAIAATDDDALNQRVSEAAEARRIFCNVVDAPKAASFIMPSIIDRSPLMVAVSSGGTSPVLARLLREKLESLLPLHLGQVAKYAGQLRGRVKQQFATMGERRRFWEKLFVNDRLAQSLANNDQKAITETTEQLINEPLDHRGEVVLVGAGPGDAGLLTLKGLQQIQHPESMATDFLGCVIPHHSEGLIYGIFTDWFTWVVCSRKDQTIFTCPCLKFCQYGYSLLAEWHKMWCSHLGAPV